MHVVYSDGAEPFQNGLTEKQWSLLVLHHRGFNVFKFHIANLHLPYADGGSFRPPPPYP